MSSEGENIKNTSSEGDEKINPEDKDKPEKMEVDKEDKENGKAEDGDSEGKTKENAQENENKVKVNTENKDKEKEENGDEEKHEKKPNKTQKDVENDAKSEDTSEKEDDENDGDDDDDDKKSVPLLDQPLEMSGTRERKKVQRFNDNLPKDSKEGAKVDVPAGRGVTLGEIPRIDASISRFKNEDLKLLHRLLFKAPGKTTMIKKNIKKFNGFDFAKDSDEYVKKLGSAQKFEIKQLKSMCEMLDLEKKGSKEEIAERIIEFLIEPKDSGKPVGGGRPKRTAAVKANNRGYSSHDDSYSSDEKPSPRGRRDKGKRSNLKEESSSESDEEFRPSDASEDKPRVNKRSKRTSKKAKSDEDDASDVQASGGSSEDSDVEPKNKKRKIVNSKAKPKATPSRGRGRKPAASPASAKKKTPAKKGRKPAQNTSEESEHPEEEEGSSSEDEPLVKKPKNPQPPTDEEIKSYVKDILEGANLEEITMKTVCKQVYAHYPDFDLTHKKDYIKTTVKSLIST